MDAAVAEIIALAKPVFSSSASSTEAAAPVVAPVAPPPLPPPSTAPAPATPTVPTPALAAAAAPASTPPAKEFHGKLCEKGCGNPSFGKFRTCCTHCRGPAG